MTALPNTQKDGKKSIEKAGNETISGGCGGNGGNSTRKRRSRLVEI
jgi:hypothetical protein